jgi:hypothetical protein
VAWALPDDVQITQIECGPSLANKNTTSEQYQLSILHAQGDILGDRDVVISGELYCLVLQVKLKLKLSTSQALLQPCTQCVFIKGWASCLSLCSRWTVHVVTYGL